MSYAPLVEALVKGVVDSPEKVTIEEEFDMGTRTFHVAVEKEDVGKIIGKSGRVINAIRFIVSAVASKSKERAYVKVVTEA
ncbi:MAG: KH domain-containing protein [Fimbriimonadaceae bacterium]|nr:KH domain-containing protein [Fimbriimonadaceae bacterium]